MSTEPRTMPPRGVSPGDLLTRTRALAGGMSDRSFARLTTSGEWVRVWRGCVVRKQVWEAWSERQRRIAQHLAFASVSHARVVFDGPSALLLHGYSLARDPVKVHVTALEYPRPSDPRVVGHRFFGEGLRTETVYGSVRVLEESRAVLETVLRGTPREGVVHLDQGLRRGIERERLEAMLGSMAGRNGVGVARYALPLADARSESVLESVARYELLIGGVPAPELQVRVETMRGTKFLDLGWPDRRLGLEVDGVGKYFDYRPTAEAVHAEHVRERAVRAAGWEILRTDASEIYRRPDQLVARVMAALRSRS